MSEPQLDPFVYLFIAGALGKGKPLIHCEKRRVRTPKISEMENEEVIDVDRVANHKRKLPQDHNVPMTRRKLNKVEIPDEFLCPITQELMEDPVSTEDGHVYDRKSIEQWFKDHHTSPTTNVRLKSKKLIPNLFAKKQIQQFKELNQICSVDEFFSYVQNGNLTKLQNTNFPDAYLTQYTLVEWTIGKNAISAAAIHIAVHHRHLEVLKWLLEQGVVVDFPILSAKPAACGATALHYAAHLGYIDCMQILLGAGAKHTSVTEWGITPLHWCANPEAVELLIRQGANVNIQAPGNSNFTPLHYAAWNNSTTLAGCLLRFGAEVNTRGSNGRTPLHIAAKKGNQMVAKILMDHGANPKMLDNSNRNVIDLARAYLSETMANFIEKYSEEIKEQSQHRIHNQLTKQAEKIEQQELVIKAQADAIKVLKEIQSEQQKQIMELKHKMDGAWPQEQ